MESTFGTALLVIVFSVNLSHNLISTAQLLPDSEVQTLRIISTKLGIKQWDDVKPSSCLLDTGLNVTIELTNTLSNVTCNCTFESGTVCHITRIQLKNMNLTGELPDEFANFSYLIEIDLSHNNLNGSIPKSWASLPLVILSLLGNYISGTIPSDIAKIATLEELVLEDNFMEGTLPPELGNLRRLRRAFFSGNNFTGTVPETFANLTSLTDFRISGTSISGRIPMFIGNWKNLTRLHLQGTSMEGPVPDSISLMGNLTELIISDLNVSNMIFPNLKALIKLKELVLRNCSIVGQLPPYMAESFKMMTNLDLSFNRLSGIIPQSQVQSMLESKLKWLYLTNNSLEGDTSWLSSTESNKFMDQLIRNKDQFLIEPGVPSQNQLAIDISYNNFSGKAKSTCRTDNVNKISSYSTVDGNSIEWCLKKGLPCSKKANFYRLFINCGGRGMQFEKEQYEQDVEEMGASSFYSTENWASSTTGDFLGKEGNSHKAPVNSDNDDIYSSARLAPLSLKYYGLCLREGSYTVKLHFAEVMFTIYANNTKGRRIFDVYIQGDRVLKDFNVAEEAGGIGRRLIKEYKNITVKGSSLEIHLHWRGKGTMSVPKRGVYGPLISAISITPNFDVSNGLSAGAIAGIVVGSFVAVLLLLIVLWKLGYLGKDSVDDELRGLELQTGYFSLRQIKAATDNFAPSNKIGEGGFGPVHKGTLSDNLVIAVKQLSSKSRQGNREFITEIGFLSALQHPNLVRLHGCCIEGKQLLLIYEYMENNSLANALFGPELGRLNLDWPTRQKICLGIAKGLSYLHEESPLKIVHRDMKATNVLLDKDLNAKISDFGLAKLDDEENTHISTRIAGTVGYMAPEYAMRGYLTEKADIYSFGIIALEIVSGKSNTNFRPKEESIYLLDWAYVLHEKGTLLDLIDPCLGANFSKKEALKMLNIGLMCSNQSPTVRPAMSAVVRMLESHKSVQAMPVLIGTMTDHIRLQAFQKLSEDSQSQNSLYPQTNQTEASSISMNGPWVDSMVSIPENETVALMDLYDVHSDMHM